MDLDLAYFAGFIDGEGCLGTALVRAYGTRAKNTTPYHQVRLSATNANKAVLEALRERFGGNVTAHHPHGVTRHKDVWRWTLVSRRAADAIRILRPYLRVKGRQADLCLTLQATMGGASVVRSRARLGNGVHRFTGVTVLPAVLRKRDELAVSLKTLNRHGR